MIGDRKKGGLGMPDFEVINNARKAVWVKQLLAPECATWKLLPFDYLRDVGGDSYLSAISHLKLFRWYLAYHHFTGMCLMPGIRL